MERIEVIVRITKDHCPPQEQKLFEWDEREQEPAGTLSYPALRSIWNNVVFSKMDRKCA